MMIIFKIASNILIIILICIIIFSIVKLIGPSYTINYEDIPKNELQNFMRRNGIKLKDSKEIIKVTMSVVIPDGRCYTIYYKDVNNKKQSEKICIESHENLKEYIEENGENLEEKYSNIIKHTFYILIIMMIVKGIVTYFYNKKREI